MLKKIKTSAKNLSKKVFTLKNFETSYQIGEIEVSYKPNLISKTKITNSDIAAEILTKIWSDYGFEWVEEVVMLPLNNQNQALGFVKLFKGGIINSVFDTRVILGVALAVQAVGFIICHNHPSGNLEPSQADIDVSTLLYSQSTIMQIKMLDSIIISKNGYYSLAENGKF